MKTLIIIFLASSVIVLACGKSEVKTNRPEVKTSAAAVIDKKRDFVPFSWQTKWFNRDLNSHLYLRGQDGC